MAQVPAPGQKNVTITFSLRRPIGSEHHLPKWLSRSLLPLYHTLFFNPCHLFHSVPRGSSFVCLFWIESSTLSRNGAWALQLLHLSSHQEFSLLSSPHPLPKSGPRPEKDLLAPFFNCPQKHAHSWLPP